MRIQNGIQNEIKEANEKLEEYQSQSSSKVQELLVFTDKAYITYDLKREYAFLKCTYSIQKNLVKDGTGTIKADGKEVYRSPALSKYDDILEIEDIPINNCSMLTIEYATDGVIRGIISDIEVYNL